jgi:hypothetical protein
MRLPFSLSEKNEMIGKNVLKRITEPNETEVRKG